MSTSLLQQGKREGWHLDEDTKAALTKTPDLVTRYDPVSATVSYVGKAVVGTATSAATWQIRRLTLGASGSVIIEYADGNHEYDNIWDNRASLAYS